jgi:hypothetical protein
VRIGEENKREKRSKREAGRDDRAREKNTRGKSQEKRSKRDIKGQ